MIAVPHTNLHPLTARWAQQHSARLFPLDPQDMEAYWRLLLVLWTVPGDLLVVEHDMIPAKGVTEAMTACKRPWCVSPYPVASTVVHESLGCTRFAARLKVRHPELMAALGKIGGDGLPAKDWRRLDVRLAALLRAYGYRAHQHRKSTHLHEY